MISISDVRFRANTSKGTHPQPERTDPYCEFNGQRYYLKDTERANKGGYYAGALMLTLASLLAFGSMWFTQREKTKPIHPPEPVSSVQASSR